MLKNQHRYAEISADRDDRDDESWKRFACTIFGDACAHFSALR